MRLPVPQELKGAFPLSPQAQLWIQESRRTAQRLLFREDPRYVAIFGPCSIHDPTALDEFAKRFLALKPQIEDTFFPVLRFFIEKPRTHLGWKGLLYDPHLDGSNNLTLGLHTSRKLLVQLAEMGIPCATELLDPLAVPYFDDLIVWGMIGARTSASQPHRQMASGLPFPVGFKNDVYGQLGSAITGITASRIPHTHLGIDNQGRVTALQTKGNPLTHLVLRGAEKAPNYDPQSVALAIQALESQGVDPRLLIDCSHGNSAKNPHNQKVALRSALQQIQEGNRAIFGFMLESHIFSGKQPMEGPLKYGVSITDACLGWDETEAILLEARSQLTLSRTGASTSLVPSPLG